MLHLFDPILIIKTLGLIGVWGIVFAESGLFFGFIFPGDSLLFTAGLLASQNYLQIIPLLLGCCLAAILGDSVGYAFGRRVGPVLFSRPDSLFFKKKYLVKTQEFYAKHGQKTLVLARFVPIVRTFAPILAGVAVMPYRAFLRFNIIGGALWSLGLTTLGYTLGNAFPQLEKYLTPIILLIILLSLTPLLYQMVYNKK